MYFDIFWTFFDICEVLDMYKVNLLRMKKYVKLLHLGVESILWIFVYMYMFGYFDTLWTYFHIYQIFDMDMANLLRLKKYVKLLHLGVFSSVLTVSNSEVSFPKDIQGLQRQPQPINQTPIQIIQFNIQVLQI